MLLNLDGKGPRYAQITRALSGRIQTGELPPGTRLPATRELARDLGCSRNIVMLAYEQLTLEGYLVTRSGGGTFVSSDLPTTAVIDRAGSANGSGPMAVLASAEPVLSARGRRIAEVGAQARQITPRTRWPTIDFMFGLCEPDARGIGRIRAAFAAALRQRPFNLSDAAGDIGLRQQIAERLRGVRGMSRKAEHIFVTAGVHQATDICARLFLDEGDRVVVEDPCYEVPPAQFEALGAEVIRVPVDRHGLDVDALPESGKPVKLVYVTPSHQFPTGAVMPAARRYALLAWAKRVGALIIEDDYDGEYRYAGRPLEALAALDQDGRVLYCGTFSKSFFPSLRLGYLVLPPALVSVAASCRWLSDLGSPRLLQKTIGELMATGEYDRHIRRMLRRYRARCAALVDALERHLGTDVEIEGSEAGLHVVAWLPNLPSDRMTALLDACYARDVGVYSAGTYAARPLPRPGLLLGYGLIQLDDIEKGIAQVSEAYREVMEGQA
jgi:GntR family transcriptional regulator / MocR family aminotransferase